MSCRTREQGQVIASKAALHAVNNRLKDSDDGREGLPRSKVFRVLSVDAGLCQCLALLLRVVWDDQSLRARSERILGRDNYRHSGDLSECTCVDALKLCEKVESAGDNAIYRAEIHSGHNAALRLSPPIRE